MAHLISMNVRHAYLAHFQIPWMPQSAKYVQVNTSTPPLQIFPGTPAMIAWTVNFVALTNMTRMGARAMSRRLVKHVLSTLARYMMPVNPIPTLEFKVVLVTLIIMGHWGGAVPCAMQLK